MRTLITIFFAVLLVEAGAADQPILVSPQWLNDHLKDANLVVKFAVYNLLNQQRTTTVEEQLQGDISNFTNPTWRQTIGFQQPRFMQLTVSVDF